MTDFTHAERVGRRYNANQRHLDAITKLEGNIARWTRMAERSLNPRVVSASAQKIHDAEDSIDCHRRMIAANNARPLEDWDQP